jgi:ribonucleotide monophosphatase NagD (HAD superfamily)
MGQTVIYAGKPYPPLYDLAFRQLARLLGAEPALADILAIGDGIHTDIAGAGGRGIDAVFIASAVHVNGDAALTQPALGALFREAPHKPIAALARLAW